MINYNELKLLRAALGKLEEGFADLPDFTPAFDEIALATVLDEVATRMRDNFPYYHPQYAGQMLKPPHPIARIAYALSLWINPNNHALDGGRASSAMEKECIAQIGAMFGWQAPLGHLTGGGTMANLEALWVAGRLHPGKRIIASSQAHYTHHRISDVLGLRFSAVDVDSNGRMRLTDIERELAKGDVGTVVVTMGNTGLGAVDPLADILKLKERFDFRVHADAAYGGYFTLSDDLDTHARQAFDSLMHVDSIVIDPHKHGLQPYGCGCILYKDPSVGTLYRHDSPYTYFSSAELHLGEISLECSRPGASAVALWATQKLMPLVKDGDFAASLGCSLRAARELHHRLENSPPFVPLMPPELDIVVYAVNAEDTTTSSTAARRLFARAAENGLHLAMIELPTELVGRYLGNIEINSKTLTCLRSALMKPEHEDWCERIVGLLEKSLA
ncbi:MAG TPA: aminotransferase class V-fold PLP-dependent enzyme [Woeseiaceae bacterium]|nr:aminotransferase class V-fold PLP-dependent enzyme [Woeseiaceae bacterium]